MTKLDIENELKDFLGVTKVIWIPRGLYGKQENYFLPVKDLWFSHLLDVYFALLRKISF
jgi:hypothetical protein